MNTGTIIRIDGTQVEVQPINGDKFSLEEMQTVVGGYIEIVALDKVGTVMVVNEEGFNLPVNEKASRLFFQSNQQLWMTPEIFGHVLITKRKCIS